MRAWRSCRTGLVAPTLRHVHHAHCGAIFLQTLVSGSDDGVTLSQALQNFDFAGLAQTCFHGHALRHQGVGFVARHNFDHKGAAALRNDGLFGNDQSVFARTKNGCHAGEHAGAQLLLAVVNAGTHTHRATIGLDQGVYRLHHGRERTAGQGIDAQLCFLSGANLGLKTLGQSEVEQHRIHVFHVDHVRAIFEVIAHVDLLEAGGAVKGGQHFQALQSGLGQRHLGARDFEGRGAFIQRTLADEVLGHQFLVALVVGLGNGQLGFGLRQLRLLQLILKLHHHLAFAHTLAVGEINALDASAHFGTHHDALT